MNLTELFRNAPSLARRIVWREEVSSTNDLAKQMIQEGMQDAIVLADRQTAGRGRLGRAFYSPSSSGLYCSMVLPPVPGLAFSPTVLAACGACRAVFRLCGCFPQIKWVNDLMLDGFKICGILTENPGPAIVAGIGINVNTPREVFLPDLPHVSSLAGILGRTFSLEKAALLLIQEIDATWQNALTPAGAEKEFLFYREHLATLGKEVLVLDAQGERRGMALDLDRDAALLVDFGNGPERVIVGDVSVRGLAGYQP